MVNNCISLYKKEQEEKLIKSYYGECLRLITENTAKMGHGSYISAKLIDLLNPKPQEKRTPDEIINRIRNKIDKINS